MPQPRSIAVCVTAAWSRPARWVPTLSRVACSRPSWVKYMRAARSPNFGTARRRSSAWVSAAATRSAAVVRRSSAWTASSSYPVSAVASTARASSAWPSSVSSQAKASRSTPGSVAASSRPRRPTLALTWGEC